MIVNNEYANGVAHGLTPVRTRPTTLKGNPKISVSRVPGAVSRE
jgi:hypothetical protein